MKSLKYISLVFLLGLSPFAKAQQENTFFFMGGNAQSLKLNPAFRSDHKLTFCFPCGLSAYVGAGTGGFAFNDFYDKNPATGKYRFTPEDFTDRLKSGNRAWLASQKELLLANISVSEKLQINFNIATKADFRLDYKDDLFRLLTYGNGDPSVIGQKLNIAPQINLMAYSEYAAGASYKINEKITVGGRAKMLFGLAQLKTDNAALNIQTDPDNYNVNVSMSGKVYTSNTMGFYLDQRLTPDTLYLNPYNPFDEKNRGNFKPKLFTNAGFAVDLGGTYQLNDKLQFSAGLIDFGSISWKNKVTVFETAKEGSQFVFKGADFKKLFDNKSATGSQPNPADVLYDSLQSFYRRDLRAQIDAPAYSTALPLKVYAGGQFLFNDKFNVGANLFLERYAGKTMGALGISANKKLGDILSVSGSYSYRSRSPFNIGLGLGLDLGPLQWYIVGDHLISNAALLVGARNMGFRTGFMWRFGKIKPKETNAAVPTDLGK